MKLSMSMIAEYLAPYHPECHILNDTQTITGVRFFSDRDTHFSRENVYLGNADSYFQDPKYKNALLLANGENQILCPSADYEDLLNDVLSAFDYYRDLEQQLLILSTESRSVLEYIPLVETVFSDPFLVFDLDGKNIFSIHSDQIQDETLKENIRNQSSLGANVISRKIIKKDGKIAHDLADFPQFTRIEDTSDLGAVAMYITVQKEKVGFILLLPSTIQKAAVGMCLLPFFTRAFASATEFTEGNNLQQSPQSILRRLLEQGLVADNDLPLLQKEMSCEDAYLFIVCKNTSIQNYTLRHLLIRDIEQSSVKAICCDYQEQVVILLAKKDQEAVLSCIHKSTSEDTMAIGVSMPFFYPQSIPIAYKQAVFALPEFPKTGVAYSEDLALPYLFNVIREKEMASHLLHPVCFQLEKLDREHHSDLYQTLETFLFCKMSRTETAKQLHIHLNTLKYRLNRIQELCDVDLESPETLFYLQLSFAVRKR